MLDELSESVNDQTDATVTGRASVSSQEHRAHDRSECQRQTSNQSSKDRVAALMLIETDSVTSVAKKFPNRNCSICEGSYCVDQCSSLQGRGVAPNTLDAVVLFVRNKAM